MGKLLVWIMILGSVASSVAAQKRSDPFFFIQLSDPQLGFIDDNRSYARETELMELFTDAINRLRPAFVVVTGDMVHDLNDAGQVAEFDRLIAGSIRRSRSILRRATTTWATRQETGWSRLILKSTVTTVSHSHTAALT